ncbi:MAG: glycosyltransferase, partial [Acidobacteriota bacterium]|nr:glycosyltransferase [Acidobacteriota bacterium]
MSVEATTPKEAAPQFAVSVIVPARNEEAALGACLASLLVQSEPGFALGRQWELFVVDDHSTDGTAAIARQAVAALQQAERAGVHLLQAPELDLSQRGGFTGKTNACWAAAQRAQGRWLLFTDADTVHQPGDVSRSLHEAAKYKVALLSYSPRQLVSGLWQRAVMPLVFSELASVYPTRQINDPENRLAAANGQFLLVEREAYFAAGGHRAVGANVLEDVALAENVKRARNGIRLRYAPDALATRMYRSTAEMIEGWTKNLAVLMPSPLALAFWRMLDLVLLLGLPPMAFLYPQHVPAQRAILLLLWLRNVWRYFSRVARSNFSAVDVALSVVGLPLFVSLLLRSAIHHRIK